MKADFSDAMANSDVLLYKAESVLKQRLSENKNDENILLQLAEILRQRGEIDNALEFYQKLLYLNPDHQKAKLLSAILKQQSVNNLYLDGSQPVAYVQINNFLDQEQRKNIWNTIKQKKNKFSDALVDKSINPSYRNSNILYKNDLKEISDWFLKKVNYQLGSIWPRLLVEPFKTESEELQLTLHQDGEFYKIHTDDQKTDKVSTRKITFVYYFHHQPKKFKGGDLLLFDTDVSQDSCVNKYTRVSPDNNSIIFFPSNIYHQVTPVSCNSPELENGRFTLNGWLHNE